MAFSPDGRLFVCQQGGQLRVIKNGVLLATPFVSLTVDANGERGLLGVTFDPHFASNQFVYVYYTTPTPSVHNRVSRFTASGDVAVPGSEVVILELNNLTSATNHNGGAIHFGPDNKLYIATGENANTANSQSLNNLLGKILRINADGSIPADNPFFNSAVGSNRAIWALGLRNPYTFAFQPGTGRMFINDVGAGTWEEINIGQAGGNYGWPNCEGSCSNPAFINPHFAYPHSGASTTGCAITGGAFYNPSVNQFPAPYRGAYFFADFCAGFIKRIDPVTAALTDFASSISSPVDLQVGPDGALYYLARGGGGRVFRVQFDSAPAPPEIRLSANNYTAAEGSNSSLITVTRLGDLSATVEVGFGTSNGSANQSSDYTNALGTITFSPGETNKTILLLITDDHFVEGNETLTLTLTSPTRAVLGSPATAVFTITDNDVVSPTANPIDTTQIFVRQQYSDFLNRLPDDGGLAYWSNEIDSCGSNLRCMHERRIGVSAAFFVEAEFQETGFFINRMYKAGLDRRPTYLEFMRDRSRLHDTSNLVAEKLDYANDFAAQGEFANRFPLNLNATQYIDALVQGVENASGVDFSSRSGELLAEYNLGGNQIDSRARVLVKLIEYADYRQVEFNSAFVLAQYFGYLRRDPDEGGYVFWLDILNNRVPNNHRSMVCAFLTSTEFQQRFSSVVTRHNSDCGP
jgi:glucose/arabinose dehydrogenase